jgi:predicted nucleotidyltransferase
MKAQWSDAATSRQRAATEEVVRRLHARLPGRSVSVTLFGSVARGDFTDDSDIDLLVVADSVDTDFKWEAWGIGSEVSLEFDVIFNLHIYSRAQWARLRAYRRSLWRNVEQEGVELTLHPIAA